MATLFTLGSWTSGGYTGTLTVSYSETIDISNNVSNLPITLTWSGNRSSATLYSNGLRVRVGTQWWTAIANGGNANDCRNGKSHTFVVPHNNDGTGSVEVYVEADISGGSPDFKSKTATITLTKIPRGHSFSLNSTMITKGQTITLTAVKNVEAYRSTITFDNGVVQGEIGRNQSRTSWEISYDTLSNSLATGITRNVAIICKTINYDTGQEIATTILYVAVNTGHIAFSLYDDGSNVGATVGERATSDGFCVKGIKADFTQATEVDFTGTTVKGLGTLEVSAHQFSIGSVGTSAVYKQWAVPTKEGYTALGILGYSQAGSSSTAVNIVRLELTGGQIYYTGRSLSGTGSNMTITVEILWLKN